MLPNAPRLLAYALPAVPLAALALPMTVIVPSAYAKEMGVPIAAVGFALLVVRLFDAVTDPVVGYFSDHVGGRYRRKLWFALGIPLILVGSWMTLVPPQGAGAGHLAFWGMFLSLGTTATALAYAAWGAELTPDYKERNRVAAFRETVTVIGTVLVTATPALLPAFGFTTQRDVLWAIALAIMVLLPFFGGVALFAVPEPQNRSTTRLDIRDGLRHLGRNKPFLRLIVAFFLNGLANGLPASLFLFFVAERLGGAGQEPVFLLIYFFCAVVSVPFWLRLAGRLPKHRVWAAAMLLASVAFISAVLLPSGALVLYGIICVVTGFALGADLMLPPSIQADVIDVDTAASGEQRSGFYFAIWALAQKAALAFAVGIAFPVLALSGFDPAKGLRTEMGLTMLAVLYAGFPVVLKLVATALMWRFPVDGSEQARLRATIEARLG
ncbi:MAG: MFS transporter [Rhizobiales bacterium]|nr:MFS transporter [Hyphomicrobiales bacterium]